MASDSPRVRLHDHLPEIYRAHDIDGVDNRFVRTFLAAFEILFEDLQSKIEGDPGQQAGGIPDLFHPNKTPPSQFLPQQDATEYLSYLASWIGLPLRPEQGLDWNRTFVETAIKLYPQRGTLLGLEGMLRAWLRGDIEETKWDNAEGSFLPIVTDLTRPEPDSDSLFRLRDTGETVRLGIDSVLGEGPPFFFIVDVTLSPLTDGAERETVGVEALIRTTRQLLDAEKPAHTYYQLRVRAQLTSNGPYEIWTYDSDLEAAQ